MDVGEAPLEERGCGVRRRLFRKIQGFSFELFHILLTGRGEQVYVTALRGCRWSAQGERGLRGGQVGHDVGVWFCAKTAMKSREFGMDSYILVGGGDGILRRKGGNASRL